MERISRGISEGTPVRIPAETSGGNPRGRKKLPEKLQDELSKEIVEKFPIEISGGIHERAPSGIP